MRRPLVPIFVDYSRLPRVPIGEAWRYDYIAGAVASNDKNVLTIACFLAFFPYP